MTMIDDETALAAGASVHRPLGLERSRAPAAGLAAGLVSRPSWSRCRSRVMYDEAHGVAELMGKLTGLHSSTV